MIPCNPSSVASTKSLDEAVELCNQFNFTNVPVDKSDIAVNEEGHFTIQENVFPITTTGITNVCSSLRIPNPFANRIPDHVLVYDINELMKNHKENVAQVFFNPKEEIVDINFKSRYVPVSNSDLLLQVSDRIKPKDDLRFMFEDAFLKMEIAGQEATEIKAANQIHKLGNIFQHYPTNKSVSKVSLMLWTLVCTNGMIAPREFGFSRLKNKGNKEIPVILNEFISEGMQLLGQENNINEILNTMETTMMDFKSLKRTVSRFKRQFGEDEVVSIVGEDAYADFEASKGSEDEEITDTNWYQIYYNVTDYASNKTNSAMDSRNLQNFAGRLLLKEAA